MVGIISEMFSIFNKSLNHNCLN